MIIHLLVNTLFGAIAGLAWSFALGNSLKTGLLYGAIVGIVLGLLLSIMDRTARASGKVTKSEAIKISTSQSPILFFVAIIAALISWLIKIIFF